MKKLLLRGGLFSILLTASIVSCKKEVAPNQVNLEDSKKQEVTTDGRMLIFNSSATYTNIVSNPDQEAQIEFALKVSKMSHTTYAEKIENEKSVDLIDDEYLSAIINEDAIVQIGDYLYRINKTNEKVFVLPASHLSEYSDLVNENKANKSIRQFSTDDCVIELAEGGDAGEKGLFCNDRKANEKSKTSSNVTVMSNPFVEMYIKASYNKFGVYFTVKAEGTHQTVSTSNYKFYFQIENSSYAQRCGSSLSNYSHPWRVKDSGTVSGGVQTEKFLFYNGTTQLKNYNFQVRFRCENWLQPSSPNPYTVYFTEYVTITDY